MILLLATTLLLLGSHQSIAFSVERRIIVKPRARCQTTSSDFRTSLVLWSSSVDVQPETSDKFNNRLPVKTTLGLLTFDLDDTIYPLDKVIEEANRAFARAMETYGFSGIQPHDINRRSMKIREEMDPQAAMVLTHTELRKRAIRAEMEDVMLRRKLEETAEDWATNVESLGKIVVDNAKKYVLNEK
jgi:hypothetical protein